MTLLLLLSLLALACEKKPEPDVNPPVIEGVKPSKAADHALILYSAGFNNLSNALSENIGTLKKGFIPGIHDSKMLFILEHHTAGSYSDRTSPTLTRLYLDEQGKLQEEVILKLFTSTFLTDPNTMKAILSEIDKAYDIQTYGMIFSSHSSGYLPKDYLEHERYYENGGGSDFSSYGLQSAGRIGTVNEVLGYPLTKSLGADFGGPKELEEMDFIEFCASLPVNFEYILFDSCLMGGIEVAYELKDKCKVIGASPTEVMAKGINYTNITDHIFNGDGYGLTDISREYMEQYRNPDEPYPHATWALVETAGLDALAERCATLFETYRSDIEKIDGNYVQEFFYLRRRHFHYDFLDILRQVCNPQEIREVEDLLDRCILFKDATPYFLNCRIEKFSGLSMMLPSDAGNYLKNYYKNLAWNKATQLVK